MYLLDTAVVFELRRSRSGGADAAVTAWATRAARQSLFVSAFTVLELDSAAVRLSRKDKAAGAALRGWVDGAVRRAFEGRILPVDEAVVTTLGRMPPLEPRNGLLAATARQHGLTLVTRNTAAFKASRVKLLNPWSYLGDEAEPEGDWRQAARSGPVWLKNLFVR